MSEEKNELLKGPMMDEKLAKEMIRAYAEASQNPLPFTRSIWFPFKKIDNLFKTMTEEGANGVRIYFGVYTPNVIQELNKDPDAHKIPAEFAGRVTIIFVTTQPDGSCTGKDDIDKKSFFMPPENRGLLCPPKSGCDCDSNLVDPKPASCNDPI